MTESTRRVLVLLLTILLTFYIAYGQWFHTTLATDRWAYQFPCEYQSAIAWSEMMITEVFKAAVQYGDHKGTAAADDHDRDTLEDYLRGRGLIKDEDRVVGVKMFSGEVHANRQEHPIHVTAYILSAEGFDQAQQELQGAEPIPVRAVNAEMELADFFGLYKRFEVAISRHSELSGRDIRVID